MNPEFTSFVTRGGHHSPLGGIPYGQRLPSVFGMIPLFHRGVKGIRVNVYDFTHSVIILLSCRSDYLIGTTGLPYFPRYATLRAL
jgi:hypothetical protein